MEGGRLYWVLKKVFEDKVMVEASGNTREVDPYSVFATIFYLSLFKIKSLINRGA